MQDQESFRQILQKELRSRCTHNPNYSLRALAKSLEIEPSFLSKIIRNKRKLTAQSVQRLASKLGFSQDEISKFLSPPEETPFHTLPLDQFELISEWYHYAILELMTLKGAKFEPAWIAQTLGITLEECHEALARLQRLQMIRKVGHKRWVNISGDHTTTGHSFSTTAFRKLQAQILRMAIHALESIPMEHRDQSSITMAVDSDRLTEAKGRIKKFRRELMKFLQSGPKRDSVYQFSTSLFPITPIKEKSK